MISSCAPMSENLCQNYTIILSTLVLLPTQASADVLTPSLAETLAWMDSTYNSHEDIGGAFGHGRWEIFSIDGLLFERRMSSFSYNECNISLITKDDPTTPLFIDTMYSITLYKFRLGDLDPYIVSVEPYSSVVGLPCDLNTCDRAKVEFETHNDTPNIDEKSDTVFPKAKGADHEAVQDRKTFAAQFYVDDVAYARRFADAFRHAIKLCGGVRSPF
jgi:hypothetical protein